MRCSQLLSLWLIVKDDKLYGRIAVRWPQHGRKVAVTLCMYPQNNTCSYVIFDCERVSGYSKEAALEGIAKILKRKGHELRTYYDMEIIDDEKLLAKCWYAAVELGGYRVLKAI